MALATIYGPSNNIAIDLEASIEWVMTDIRRHGETRVKISRNSSAWVPELLNEDGAFLIEFSTPSGFWRGVADVPEYTPEGAKIMIRNITHWTAIRHVGNRKYFGLTAGTLFRAAVRQGLLTSVPLTLGTVLEAPPIIPEYEFRGQSVLDILTDLSELTSQTWEINNRNQISWIPRQGLYHDFWVIDDGMLTSNIQTSTLGDKYSETIEIEPSGRKFSAYSYSSPLWPKQRTIQIGR